LLSFILYFCTTFNDVKYARTNFPTIKQNKLSIN